MARPNSRKASRGRGKRSIFRRILLFLLTVTILAICVGGLLLSGYLIKLDDEIRARFAGTRWALPAQVFSAPLDLYPGRDISSDALQRERPMARTSPPTCAPSSSGMGRSRKPRSG